MLIYIGVNAACQLPVAPRCTCCSSAISLLTCSFMALTRASYAAVPSILRAASLTSSAASVVSGFVHILQNRDPGGLTARQNMHCRGLS